MERRIMTLYATFHKYYKLYQPLKEKQAELIRLKQELFNKALPSSIRYDRDKVNYGGHFNMLDCYMEQCEDEDIDNQLDEINSKIKELLVYMNPIYEKLVKSDYLTDIIYLQYYLEHKPMRQIAKSVGVSRATICKYNKQIKEEIEKV